MSVSVCGTYKLSTDAELCIRMPGGGRLKEKVGNLEVPSYGRVYTKIRWNINLSLPINQMHVFLLDFLRSKLPFFFCKPYTLITANHTVKLQELSDFNEKHYFLSFQTPTALILSPWAHPLHTWRKWVFLRPCWPPSFRNRRNATRKHSTRSDVMKLHDPTHVIYVITKCTDVWGVTEERKRADDSALKSPRRSPAVESRRSETSRKNRTRPCVEIVAHWKTVSCVT